MTTAPATFNYAAPELAGPQFWDAVEELRSRGPLVQVEDEQGTYWAATAQDVVVQILQDWETFVSSQGVARSRPSFDELPTMTPIELDPPRQKQYRRQVNPMLTPNKVLPLEADIRKIANELIDSFVADGEGDIAVQFARKFPGTVYFRLVAHCSDEDFHRAEPAARAISFESDDPVKFATAAADLREWASKLFRERAEEAAQGCPLRHDAVDTIAHLNDGGADFNDAELFSGLQILTQGGIGTSASLIGAVMLALAQDHSLQARVRADHGLVDKLVEEVLRLEAPVPMMFRTVARDVEIAGVQLKAGEKVCAIIGAAGRDPQVFDHATELDLDRPHTRHITFGAGVHRCIGSNLARLQVRVAIEELLNRLGTFRLQEGGDVVWLSRQSRGPVEIPLEWEPANA